MCAGTLIQYCKSSIGRKQIVAVTGLLLIGFVAGHLAGNFFIYGGPGAFNGYAKKLEHLRPALNFVEAGLLFVFVVHMWFTVLLVLENMAARRQKYLVKRNAGNRSWATRLMPFTGTAVLAFVIWHLLDFTFADKHGPRSFIGGQSYGLYGVVVNAFRDPAHSILYILAMLCVGLHLSHAFQSVVQTFGLLTDRNMRAFNKISHTVGMLIAFGYISIPLYVLFIKG